MKKKIILFISIIIIISGGCFLCYYLLMKNSVHKKYISADDVMTTEEITTLSIVKGNKPVITLLGRDNYKIVKNGVYEEYGVKVIDEEDGDLSNNVEIINNLDVTIPGDYVITYKVIDSDNNEVSIDRHINVFEVTDPDRDGIAVLMYHYFYDDEAGETGKSVNYLRKSSFVEQLKYLSENDYYIPSMKELSLYIDGKLDLPKKSVILTLDDGEESNYRIAYPLAVEYKIPLIWFVVTSWTDVSMEYQQGIYNSGYVIYDSHTDDMHKGGCSGMQHGALIQCVDYNIGVNDLKSSISKLGRNDALAYPCGDTNEYAKGIVKDAGVELAFTTEYGKVKKGDDKLQLNRIRVSDGVSLKTYIDSL